MKYVRAINFYIQDGVAQLMDKPDNRYPQHQEFKRQEEVLRGVETFIEWFLQNGPKNPNYECACCGADERLPLYRLSDRQKGDLIMECFGIDVKAFYDEKDQMVEDLRTASCRQGKET